MNPRTERERRAYDEDRVFEVNTAWHRRFIHVFECPNTLRHERLFEKLLQTHANSKRVLDIGCGKGDTSRALIEYGASYVLGIDVATSFLQSAAESAIPGRLEFSLWDITQPIDGTYDLITGRAILHHIDFRPVLLRLYDKNLATGGAMIFMEPLGSNLLIRAYQIVSRAAHTPDERSLTRSDLQWLAAAFPHLEMFPINWLSLPAGILSTFLFSSADNALTRAADRLDMFVASRMRFLHPSFRQVILVIKKG
jgi:2-polyprenyl-3-methyl-5-hydroxy-6-metoxy-1,4-benzoquinol methylase